MRLKAHKAGFYQVFLDQYENGPAARNRAASIEAVQNIIPDEYYLGQKPDSRAGRAQYEAEAERLSRDFNPQLKTRWASCKPRRCRGCTKARRRRQISSFATLALAKKSRSKQEEKPENSAFRTLASSAVTIVEMERDSRVRLMQKTRPSRPPTGATSHSGISAPITIKTARLSQ